MIEVSTEEIISIIIYIKLFISIQLYIIFLILKKVKKNTVRVICLIIIRAFFSVY
jgi:hypothetical protein